MNKNSLTDLEKFCLDSYLINKDVDRAYSYSREKRPTCTDDNLHRLALRWLRTPYVKAYLAEREAVLSTQMGQKNGVESRSKDDIINELNLLATKTTDAKQRADILLKIADLQQMKREENKDEETTIHYYLPLTCSNCALYEKANKN